MTHDPLCPVGVKPWEDTYCCQKCSPGETPPWERACQCALIAQVRADERDKRQGSIDATLTLFSQDIRSLDNCVGDHEARLRSIEQILRGES